MTQDNNASVKGDILVVDEDMSALTLFHGHKGVFCDKTHILRPNKVKIH